MQAAAGPGHTLWSEAYPCETVDAKWTGLSQDSVIQLRKIPRTEEGVSVQAAADLDTPKVLAAVADLSLWFRAHVPDVLDIHPAGMSHQALSVGLGLG